MHMSFEQLSVLFLLRVETIDGTAEAGSDYKPLKEEITFAINERLREIYIEIIDDDEWEPDEIFFVKLSMPIEHKDAVVGKMAINQITIINDDGKKRASRLSDCLERNFQFIQCNRKTHTMSRGKAYISIERSPAKEHVVKNVGFSHSIVTSKRSHFIVYNYRAWQTRIFQAQLHHQRKQRVCSDLRQPSKWRRRFGDR